MKNRTFVIILILNLVVLIVVGCASMKKSITDEELIEAYTGTWILNPEWGVYKPKRILYPGKWVDYATIESKKPYCYGDIELMQKWTNSKGDIFFEYKFECNHGTTGYELVRISDSGNTMELLYTKGEKRVEEWDPDNLHYTYLIYYRQE